MCLCVCVCLWIGGWGGLYMHGACDMFTLNNAQQITKFRQMSENFCI